MVPLTHIIEVLDLEGAVRMEGDRELLQLRGEAVPLVRLRRVLQVAGVGAERSVLVTDVGGRHRALGVDELMGREQILITGFTAARGTLPLFTGATVLAEGRPTLVLDPSSAATA